MIEFIKWFIPAIMHNKTMFSSLSVKNIENVSQIY